MTFGAQQKTQTNFAAGVPVYWDVCDREDVKIQDCYVSALLSAWALFRRHLGFAANRLLGMLFSNVCRWFRCSKSSTSRCVISLNILPFCLKESLLLFFKACWNDATTFLPFSKLQSSE